MTVARRLDAAHLFGLHLVDAALRARPPAHHAQAAAHDEKQGSRLLACCLAMLHVLDLGELVSGPKLMEALVRSAPHPPPPSPPPFSVQP